MDPRRFKELILKILDGTINEKELDELSRYVKGIIRNVSSILAQKHGGPTNQTVIDLLMTRLNLNRKEALNQIFDEVIIKILTKRQILVEKDLDSNGFKRYVMSIIYNQIVDIQRDLSRRIRIKYDDEEKIIKQLNKDIYDLAKIELKQSLNGSLKEEDIKYLCYFLSSQRYKCLWTGKKENAIYQDVRRNKERVLKKLGEVVHDLNLDEEVYEDVIKPVLSEICEELRNKKCKGGDS